MANREDTLILFDVDGTLTKSRQVIEPWMHDFLLNEVKPKAMLGLVSGSDLNKVLEQMGGEHALQQFDYIFSENGLVAYENGKLTGVESIHNFMGEEKLQKFINFCLGYMSKLTLPCKRGTFVEFRKGMINICPVGRSCTMEERQEFFEYDNKHEIRKNFVKALEEEFPNLGLKFSLGGQISFDAFPFGWDKTFCLKYLTKFSTIHFFGDRTLPGENDHEIYEDSRTVGHRVTNPQDTKAQLQKLLGI